MTPGEKFGHSIRRFRLLANCTQEDVANNLQISQTNLRRIELGHGNPRYNTATALANYLATHITGEPQNIELFDLEQVMEEITIWRYKLVPETWYWPEIGWYPTYKIVVETLEKGTWQVKDPDLDVIHDVMLDEAEAQKLVDKLNDGKASPLHLREILEDFL